MEVFGVDEDQPLDRILPLLTDASFVDDAALPIAAGNDVLEESLAEVMQVVDHEITEAGMTLNLDKGKSQIFLVIRGAGAKSIRAKLYGPESKVKFATEWSQESEIGTARIYQHLGTHKPPQLWRLCQT